MHIALVARPGHENSGVGRYCLELKAALEAAGKRVTLVHPKVPFPGWLTCLLQRWFGWDLQAFFETYPLWASYPSADVYHLTSQNLATLMLLRRPPGPTIITVHDIVPWVVRHDPELRSYEHRPAAWFDRLALLGLRRADALIADSTFTQISLQRPDVAVGDSVVVPLGVD